MRKSRIHWRWPVLVPMTGLLFVNGCLAAAERGIDLVSSPAALANTLRVPYSAVSGFVGAVVGFVSG